MSESSKKAAGTGTGQIGGYGGNAVKPPQFNWRPELALVGDDGQGFPLMDRVNEVAGNARLETTDRQKRREQGYRGL